MAEKKQCEKGFVWRKVINWSKGTKKGGGRGGVRLNLMQCGDGPDHGREEAGAAADILLSRWKQNLNWGMVHLTSEEHNK